MESALQICTVGFRRFVNGAAWRWPFALSVLVATVRLLDRPMLAPRHWEELAVAFGLRPPTGALSGLWTLLLAGLQEVCPPDALVLVLWIVGALAAGLLVFLCDRLFDWFLPTLLRARLLTAPDGLLWKRVLTGGGAVLFVCSDAVWGACRAPGAALGQITVMLAGVVLLVGLLRRGWHYGLPFVTFALGLLTGDGLFSAFLFAAVILYLRVRGSGTVGRVANELANPIVLRTVTARAAFGYLGGLAVACVANVAVYRALGGVARTTTEAGDVLQSIVGDWLEAAVAACSPGALVFVLLIVLVPLAIVRFAIFRLWPKSGETTALFLLPVGFAVVVALSQLTGFGCAGVWLPSARRAGDFARALWSFGGLLAVVWGLAAIVARTSTVTDLRWRYSLLLASGFVAALMYASALPLRFHPIEGDLQDLVETYCREVADECAGDSRVLTDGSLDAGVELAAWRQGRRLIALSAVSGASPREVKLRQRGVTDPEDLKALESGAADALREWLDLRTNRIAGVAAQTGFDRRRTFAENVRPRFSGLVAHFGGTDGPPERMGREAARTLGRRIAELCRETTLTGAVEPALREAFRSVQWRVAVACRQRLGNPKTPVAELTADSDLAEELESLNPVLGVLRRKYGWQAEYHGALILPREGVRLALAKRDFNLAGVYAEQVLKVTPDDAEANFAMGMNHYLNRQYARAVPHLLRVLEVQGENPGVLNDLAMAYLRLERWPEALAAADRACRAAPGDAAIRKSAARIRSQVRAHGGAPAK